MSFSLLNSAWIPVLRKNGHSELIRPWELTSDYDTNPVESLAAVRPDFAGAHLQFLVGLLQTTMARSLSSESGWYQLYTSQPTPEQLRESFAVHEDKFQLDGHYPRFMQDTTAAEASSQSVAALLIESPGEQTMKRNTDHFIKRGRIDGMCPACAASALLTLQINAPAGGQGHRTSLRGGGPLSTLLLDTTPGGTRLWRTVWLNVLPEKNFNTYIPQCNSALAEPEAIFPWMGTTRVSDKGEQTSPDTAHPLHAYWATPRRIHLDTGSAVSGVCSICAAPTEQLITTYRTKNYGFDYKGPWQHPLSPYTQAKSGEWLPEHGQPGGVRYRHWPGYVYPTSDNAPVQKSPAHVVQHFTSRARRDTLAKHDLDTSVRLFAFGYDMDNMKARCWYESSMPLVLIHPDYVESYQQCSNGAVNAADKVAEMLRTALRSALRKHKEDVKFDASFITSANAQFWSDSEADFYAFLYDIRRVLERSPNAGDHAGEESKPTGDDALEMASLYPVKERWIQSLQKHALRCFNTCILSAPIEHNNPKRIAKAYNTLKRKLYAHTTLRDMLGLPVKLKEANKTNKKTAKKNAV